MSISDYVAIGSLIISVFSAVFVIFNNFKDNQEKKLNLTVSIKEMQPLVRKERLFIYLTFSNNSSKPLSINEIYITDGRPTEQITPTKDWEEGGLSIHKSVRVQSDNTPELDEMSIPLPITIPPYTSIGGYFGFFAGRQDSYIISNRLKLYLQIYLLDRTLETEVITTTNIRDFSYHFTEEGAKTIQKQYQYKY